MHRYYRSVVMKPTLLATSIAGLLVGGLLAILAWGVTDPVSPQTSSTLVGHVAPEMTIRSLAGGEYDLASLKGRPVVLNFWASWCVPCRQEAPFLNASARENSAIQFLGADIQDSDSAAMAYQAEVKSPYPVGPISRGSYLRFGVIAPPETYFIDARGYILARYLGPLDGRTLAKYLDLIR